MQGSLKSTHQADILPQEMDDSRMSLLYPLIYFLHFRSWSPENRFTVSKRVWFQPARFQNYSGTPTQYAGRILLQSSDSRC